METRAPPLPSPPTRRLTQKTPPTPKKLRVSETYITTKGSKASTPPTIASHPIPKSRHACCSCSLSTRRAWAIDAGPLYWDSTAASYKSPPPSTRVPQRRSGGGKGAEVGGKGYHLHLSIYPNARSDTKHPRHAQNVSSRSQHRKAVPNEGIPP